VALKAVVTSLDGIDAALHEHYTEKDGSFHLAIDDFGKHPGAVTLKTTLNKVNKDKDTLAAKVTELEDRVKELPEDFDPAEWARLKSGAKPDEAIEALKAQHAKAVDTLKTKHAADLADKDKLIGERDGYIDRTLVDGGLKDALLDVGVKPELLDGALAVLRGSVKVHRAENGDRKAVVETDMGEVGVAEFVKDWSGTKGKAYLGTASGPEAKGNNNARAGGKTMTRAEFDKMTPAAKAAVDFTKTTVVE
jgi:hypothetical protein